jgi:hypothetical protein
LRPSVATWNKGSGLRDRLAEAFSDLDRDRARHHAGVIHTRNVDDAYSLRQLFANAAIAASRVAA